MAEPAWRVLLRHYVTQADLCLRAADAGLEYLETLFYSPLPVTQAAGLVAWEVAFGFKLDSVTERLTKVERDLIRTVLHTRAAAETLALNGGNVAEHEVGAAVDRVFAMVAAAWAHVGSYRNHVLTAVALVSVVGIPDSLQRACRKYERAYVHLYDAMRRMEAARAEVTIAGHAVHSLAP